jgi:3-methyladenine DNA glycosylase/8-oxoguanine DNA glycosylase
VFNGPVSSARRLVPVPEGYSLSRTVGVLRHGASDPTCRTDASGWWFGQATPDGSATLSLRRTDDGVEAQGWGDGAAWAVDNAPHLLGCDDDPAGFVAHDALAAEGARVMAGWRVARSRLVVQSLVPAIIEQRVTGKEAFAGHTRLVRRFGSPAPGPGADLGLMVPPAPRDWANIPSWEWITSGIDKSRAETAVRASTYAGRLEAVADLPLVEAHRRLRVLPGVGEWTAAEVAQRALGDPDSPSFGDYHMAKNLTWALTGTPAGDDEARALLAPYTGQRYRAQVFITAAAGMRPRRGPRMTLPTHVPSRLHQRR